jgi:HEAT repeat protein
MSPSSLLSRSDRRKAVQRLLEERDAAGLRALAVREPRTLATLLSFLLDPDDARRWRAVEGLGYLAADRARDDLDRVRDLVRRQLWAMNDESGNQAWHAPEAIGEILYRVPALAPDYVENLACFARTYPFEAGVHWALARLAQGERPDLVRTQIPALIESLDDGNPAVRALAALALGRLGAKEAEPRLRKLCGDSAGLSVFHEPSGTLRGTTVAETAGEALAYFFSQSK